MIDSFDKEFAFLSNFYPSKISSGEKVGRELIIYPTVEHAFQAGKTLDLQLRKKIADQPTPGKAKRLGRSFKLRPDWDEAERFVRMQDCIRAKFEDPVLRRLLLNTGDQELIEGNFWHDNFWGDCRCEKCKSIKGQNNLGKMLMEERELIRRETKED